MTDRSILLKNKAVLWARDVITRADQCLVATGDSQAAPCSMLNVSNVNGQQVGTCASSSQESFEQFVSSLAGKELVIAGVSDQVVQSLRERGITVHDLLEYYRLYVNSPSAPMAKDVPSEELNAWVREVLHKMAGSSLVLDQADTGAGKWTASHFKPNASVIDKLKSIIKG